jgi:hypothetical protein
MSAKVVRVVTTLANLVGTRGDLELILGRVHFHKIQLLKKISVRVAQEK